jgi:hypothetical protein
MVQLIKLEFWMLILIIRWVINPKLFVKRHSVLWPLRLLLLSKKIFCYLIYIRCSLMEVVSTIDNWFKLRHKLTIWRCPLIFSRYLLLIQSYQPWLYQWVALSFYWIFQIGLRFKQFPLLRCGWIEAAFFNRTSFDISTLCDCVFGCGSPWRDSGLLRICKVGIIDAICLCVTGRVYSRSLKGAHQTLFGVSDCVFYRTPSSLQTLWPVSFNPYPLMVDIR